MSWVEVLRLGNYRGRLVKAPNYRWVCVAEVSKGIEMALVKSVRWGY